jgi:hypothetical protein
MPESSLVVRLNYDAEQHLSTGFRRPHRVYREGKNRLSDTQNHASIFLFFFGMSKMLTIVSVYAVIPAHGRSIHPRQDLNNGPARAKK